eukprot:gene9748-11551_t
MPLTSERHVPCGARSIHWLLDVGNAEVLKSLQIEVKQELDQVGLLLKMAQGMADGGKLAMVNPFLQHSFSPHRKLSGVPPMFQKDGLYKVGGDSLGWLESFVKGSKLSAQQGMAKYLAEPRVKWKGSRPLLCSICSPSPLDAASGELNATSSADSVSIPGMLPELSEGGGGYWGMMMVMTSERSTSQAIRKLKDLKLRGADAAALETRCEEIRKINLGELDGSDPKINAEIDCHALLPVIKASKAMLVTSQFYKPPGSVSEADMANFGEILQVFSETVEGIVGANILSEMLNETLRNVSTESPGDPYETTCNISLGRYLEHREVHIMHLQYDDLVNRFALVASGRASLEDAVAAKRESIHGDEFRSVEAEANLRQAMEGMAPRIQRLVQAETLRRLWKHDKWSGILEEGGLGAGGERVGSGREKFMEKDTEGNDAWWALAVWLNAQHAQAKEELKDCGPESLPQFEDGDYITIGEDRIPRLRPNITLKPHRSFKTAGRHAKVVSKMSMMSAGAAGVPPGSAVSTPRGETGDSPRTPMRGLARGLTHDMDIPLPGSLDGAAPAQDQAPGKQRAASSAEEAGEVDWDTIFSRHENHAQSLSVALQFGREIIRRLLASPVATPECAVRINDLGEMVDKMALKIDASTAVTSEAFLTAVHEFDHMYKISIDDEGETRLQRCQRVQSLIISAEAAVREVAYGLELQQHICHVHDDHMLMSMEMCQLVEGGDVATIARSYEREMTAARKGFKAVLEGFTAACSNICVSIRERVTGAKTMLTGIIIRAAFNTETIDVMKQGLQKKETLSLDAGDLGMNVMHLLK